MRHSRFLKGVTVGMTRGRQLVLAGVLCFIASAAMGQTPAVQAPFEPKVGQPGKDVVWVPTPDALVERMLDIAKVTPGDYLIDLGSGDGRTVIAAAKRGLRAHGIEFNPDMVTLAQAAARREGVTERATFEQADLFTKIAELRKADVITMFLLSSINLRLRPELLELEPGTRIVSNTFRMSDWEPDETSHLGGDCVSWCEALLWIVPAKVDGTWQVGNETLTLTQEFQRFEGTLGARAIESGRLNGREITFTVGTTRYTGQVQGDAITGTVSTGGTFSARRAAR